MQKLYLFLFQRINNNYFKYLLILLLFFISNENGFAQIKFAPYQNYITGSSADVVCIGDVNNDGLNDVILGTGFYFDNINDYKIFVYLQDKQGNLSTPVKYPYNNHEINSIAIGDLNNDGLNDVIIGYSDSIGIFFQNSLGTLNPVRSIFSGIIGDADVGYRLTLNVGDLNNDGLNDIAIGHDGRPNMSILYQQTDGSFTTSIIPFTSGEEEIVDIDNDGLNDLITGRIAVLYQDSSGNLGNYQRISNDQAYSFGNAFDVGDLNNDGLNDLAETIEYNDNNGYSHYHLSLFFQNSKTNQFQNSTIVNTDYSSETLKIADLNCDGRNEIVLTNPFVLQVFEQDSNNKYNKYITFPNPTASHYYIQSLSVGDINNDGRKDVVIANYNYGLVVFINQSVNYGYCCLFPVKPSIIKADSIICQDGGISTYKIKNKITNNLFWKLIPSNAGTVSFSSNDSCIIKWNDTYRGVGQLFVKDSNTCASRNSDTLKVIFNRTPKLIIGNDTTLCEHNSLLLNAKSGFTSYQWQNNPIFSDSLYTVTAVKAGITDTIFVKVTNVCGIGFDTVNVKILQKPIISLPTDTSFCLRDSIQLNITQQGYYPFSYFLNDTSINSIFTIKTPGNYVLRIKDSSICSTNHSLTVNELTKPTISFSHDTIICSDKEIILDANYTGSTYRWQDGSNNSQYIVKDSGMYKVTVSNICGTTKDSINVHTHICLSYLDVPSAFSPNGDNMNEVLYAVGKNIEDIDFIIYDRWGEKVFESKSLFDGWDGTFQSKKLETAVFVYYISARSTYDGAKLKKQGNISLVR